MTGAASYQGTGLPGWVTAPRDRPLAIAHRGASAYAPDNTLMAFSLASDLGADMWEVDIQLSRDGVPVVCHDAGLAAVAGRSGKTSDLYAAELTELPTVSGEAIPLFRDVVDLALARGAALYLDVKDIKAADATLKCLADKRFDHAVFGTSDPAFCRELKTRGCDYPVSLLVGLGMDPFALADLSGADMIHPCWERAGDRPDRLLTDAFFRQADQRGLPVVIWHEERPDVAEALCGMPVLGICSDTPQLLKPYRTCCPDGPLVVCHRGASSLAPENTLTAANAAFAAGFDIVELDVRKTADGTLAVIHDSTLDRTTTGSGAISAQTRQDLERLDAGSWFSPHYTGERVPVLAAMIDCANFWNRQLYIEITDADPAAVLSEVEARGFLDSCFFWSFRTELLRTIRETNPTALIMARREDYETVDACLQDLTPGIVEFNMSNISDEDFRAVRSAGARVMVAYMGDDPEMLGHLLDIQPDIVNINDTIGWRQVVSGA